MCVAESIDKSHSTPQLFKLMQFRIVFWQHFQLQILSDINSPERICRNRRKTTLLNATCTWNGSLRNILFASALRFHFQLLRRNFIGQKTFLLRHGLRGSVVLSLLCIPSSSSSFESLSIEWYLKTLHLFAFSFRSFFSLSLIQKNVSLLSDFFYVRTYIYISLSSKKNASTTNITQWSMCCCYRLVTSKLNVNSLMSAGTKST